MAKYTWTSCGKTGPLERALAVLDELRVITQEVPKDASIRLALLRTETNLKLPACCVLFAAEQRHAAVATFDQRLVSAAGERGLAVASVPAGENDSQL